MKRVSKESVTAIPGLYRVQMSQVPPPQPRITSQPPPLPRIDNQSCIQSMTNPCPYKLDEHILGIEYENAHTYIIEYSATLEMIKERRYIEEELLGLD